MAEDFFSIKSINIKNYKSIIDTTIQLGNFNVFIGANGCGKSNILEAIALGAAASADKLDFEFFANRGIRIAEPQLMFPRFGNSKINEINLCVTVLGNYSYDFNIYYDKKFKSKLDSSKTISDQEIADIIDFISQKLSEFNRLKEFFNNDIENAQNLNNLNELQNKIFKIKDVISNKLPIFTLSDFLIYSLEESKLRQADASNRIYPLGNHGEGLFSYLKEISKRENAVGFFNELKENLSVFDWFDDIEIPNGQLSNEFNIVLKDNYLDETLNSLDQRSTNEGFLYLLFYLTLIISDETPKFFAIENIDSSFNPKLCREVIKRLIVLAKKHGKQIIATTHNPSVLDGLDLEDDDTRLFTIRRGIDGDTKASRVTLKENLTIPLSEAWQRGYLGGLPDNF